MHQAYMSRRLTNKSLLLQGGICRCKQRDLISPWHARSWFVLSRKKGVFRSQKLSTNRIQNNVSDKNLDEKLGQAEQRSSFDIVSIEGATGIVAEKINGIYQCDHAKSYSKTSSQNSSETETETIKLLYDSDTGRWIIGQTLGSGNDTLVLAYCASPNVCDPCDVSRWFVCNAASVFLVHPCMTITRCADNFPGNGIQHKLSPEDNGDKPADNTNNPVGKKIRPAPMNRNEINDADPRSSYVYSYEYI